MLCRRQRQTHSGETEGGRDEDLLIYESGTAIANIDGTYYVGLYA